LIATLWDAPPVVAIAKAEPTLFVSENVAAVPTPVTVAVTL
jgi:hypothetical protein